MIGFFKLILRNIIFYRRTHLYTVLGVAVATAVLLGALLVGDSVRYSLHQMVFDRLGSTKFVLQTQGRYFREKLADELAGVLNTDIVPLLITQGIAVAGGGEHRINSVQVIGTDGRFGHLINAKSNVYNNLPEDAVIINDQLANRLNVKTGDEIVLRLENLDYLPKDLPLALDSDLSLIVRFKIRTIVDKSNFGHFSLKTNQVVPAMAFISLSFLSKKMNLVNRANTLLIADKKDRHLTRDILESSFKELWTPEDAGLKLSFLPTDNIIELKSKRIFLALPVIEAAKQIDANIHPVFTYFVNGIISSANTTPYSFITASDTTLIPKGMADDEIILNSWTASDLEVSPGDSITLSYYIPGPARRLLEKEHRFCVKSIVPMKGIYADNSFIPDFPGLSDQENCRDWKPGIPIDLEKIRQKDEDYWDKFRGVPKAYVNLHAAEEMWENRFGEYTAIRFFNTNMDSICQALKQHINPWSLGFRVRAVRDEGVRASAQSVDFSQLFLGLSFFIIVAALLLTALLFVFGVEQRTQETGLYLALGLSSRLIKSLVLTEGIVLAIAGSVVGVFLGIVYNKVVIYALNTLWIGAVGTSSLGSYINFMNIGIGATGGSILAIITMWLVLRKQLKYSIRTLQSVGIEIYKNKSNFKKWINISIIVACLVGVLFILFSTNPGRSKESTDAFFSAGFLLLVFSIASINFTLSQLIRKGSFQKLTLLKMSILNLIRNKKRSLTLTGLMASGLFIVFMVGANRHGTIRNADSRSSGTGGFAFFAETVLPVLYDLNSSTGLEFYGLENDKLSGMEVVPFRVKSGDDASCLNLNRVTNPQLIGVDATQLANRKAFTFSTIVDDHYTDNPWLILNSYENEIIPAVADETVIIWGLGKSVGDTLVYQDEMGNDFKVRLVAGLANSVFQGNIIISDKLFLEKYPSQSGYNLFLIDVKGDKVQIAQQLNWSLQDLGIDLVPAAERLAAFNQVENTYLSIFLLLGGLGMVLGTVGLGVVVLRSVAERREELALLRAVGYAKKSLIILIFSEYSILLLAGVLSGSLSAVIAVLPAILSPGVAIPYATIGFIFMAVVLSGIFWIWLAVYFSFRTNLLPALRNE